MTSRRERDSVTSGLRKRVAMRRPHLGGDLRMSGDVGQVQQAVSETAGDLARESLANVAVDTDRYCGGVVGLKRCAYATRFSKFTKRIRSLGSKKLLNKVLRWGWRDRRRSCMRRGKALEHNKNIVNVITSQIFHRKIADRGNSGNSSY